ncbi:MAG: hypothetical protein ACRYGG_01950 [Janthinobacterium lividum]
MKAGFRMIGRRPGPKDAIDQVKSAELLAELTAGVPAALIIASMFQRDEGGKRRIPVLLEQLKVKLTLSGFDTRSDERHPQYRLELEYGNGLTRMKWVVVRSARDFWSLHSKYRGTGAAKRYLSLRSSKTHTKFPKFPMSVFPYLRALRGYENVDSEEDDEGEVEAVVAGPSTANQNTTKERPNKKTRRSSMNLGRRMSSITDAIPGLGASASD